MKVDTQDLVGGCGVGAGDMMIEQRQGVFQYDLGRSSSPSLGQMSYRQEILCRGDVLIAAIHKCNIYIGPAKVLILGKDLEIPGRPEVVGFFMDPTLQRVFIASYE